MYFLSIFSQGPISGFMTGCEVERMIDTLWFSISADVQELSVTFETPKIFDLERYVFAKLIDWNGFETLRTPLLYVFLGPDGAQRSIAFLAF